MLIENILFLSRPLLTVYSLSTQSPSTLSSQTLSSSSKWITEGLQAQIHRQYRISCLLATGAGSLAPEMKDQVSSPPPHTHFHPPRRHQRLVSSPTRPDLSWSALLCLRLDLPLRIIQLTLQHIVDSDHHGWHHWFNGSVGDDLRPNIDILPDVSEYDRSKLYKAPGLRTKNGEQCYVFSSRDQSTVDR